MPIPRPEFRFRADRWPTSCDVCRNAIEDWNLTTYMQETPVVTVCADCAIAVTKVVMATPAALEDIAPEERNIIGKLAKASATKAFERNADAATARRLLS